MSFAETLLGNLVQDLPLLLPVLFLWVVGTLMLWPLGTWLLKSMPKRQWAGITFVVLVITLLLVLRVPAGLGFSGMFMVDGLTIGFQILVIVAAAITVILSQPQLNALKEQTVEYYALILFATSGMLLLVGATDLVSLYLSLELMALSIYILVAYFREQERGIEAGMKYFLLGAFSSGLLIYGMSLIFAAAGGKTTNLGELGQILALMPRNTEWLLFTGVVLVLAGFGFKVAAVPFHMWSPDVYEGAPTPITAFLSTAPKAAALAAFIRLFGVAFFGVHADWAAPLSFMAAASMIVGNVAALRQQSMKRLLAYSSIAHVGYMLLGVLSRDVQAGAQAIWLYMLTYLLMQGGVFAVIIYLQGKGEGESIEDFRGLSKRRPALAFAMLIFMLSLGGIPPMLGFFAKFYLFKLAIEQGFVGLTVLAFLTSAISAYYYLNVVATMYFKAAPDGEAQPMGRGLGIVVFATCLVVLVGTCFGPWLLNWTARIVMV